MSFNHVESDAKKGYCHRNSSLIKKSTILFQLRIMKLGENETIKFIIGLRLVTFYQKPNYGLQTFLHRFL